MTSIIDLARRIGQDVKAILARLGALEYRSGWRSMPLINGWTGKLYFKRVGPQVYFKAEGLNGSAATSTVVAIIPTELQTEGSINERGLLHTTDSSVSRWWCSVNAFSSPHGRPSALYGSGTWDTTAPAPSTPFGDPA